MCGKLLEKVVHTQILESIGDDILYKYQYGFRKGLSTSDAIRDLVDDLHKAINKGEVNIGIFLDFKKAFDTVDHTILINKLNGYGLRGRAKLWLENYLKDRKQVVRVNGAISSERTSKVGVPQGSILGPLLFLFYINDIKDCLQQGKMRLFADDANIFYKTSDPEAAVRLIQEDINSLDTWLKVNKLTLNAAKCNYIVIKNPRKSIPQLALHLQDKALSRTESINYLGIFIDQHLTFKDHVDHVCNNISPAVGILSKVRWILPRNVCILLYNALIHCRLSYCIESWGSASDHVLHPLEILQKRAIRFICFKSFTDHTLPLFKTLGILSVRSIFYHKICLLVFKELHGLNKVDSFGFRFAQHSMGTRSVSDQLLCIPNTAVSLGPLSSRKEPCAVCWQRCSKHCSA